MGRVLLILSAYFTLVALIWFGLGSLNIPRYQRLAAESVRTDATITATSCEQHSTVSYTFVVAGRPYSGQGLSGGERPCKDIQVGDRMPVWYLSTDPTVSTLREPQAKLENERISVGIGAVVLPAWLLVIIFVTRRIQRARAK